MIAFGSTFKLVEPTAPRVPDGATRRPLISTKVRPAPRPRSDSVFAPGPPSVTKPPNALLICAPPLVTAVPWRASVAEVKPAAVTSSRVISVTGDTELNASRRSRDPVTVMVSPGSAAAPAGCPWPQAEVATTQRPQATVALTALGADNAERTAREMVLRLDMLLISLNGVAASPLRPAAMAAILAAGMTNL